ncbi:hypothetical protein ACFX16_023567 [Malus domestica]
MVSLRMGRMKAWSSGNFFDFVGLTDNLRIPENRSRLVYSIRSHVLQARAQPSSMGAQPSSMEPFAENNVVHVCM